MKQVLSNILFFCIINAVWGQSEIEISRRVMNGESAKLGQFPYHAIFMVDNEIQCGASIIHKRWVLTAAHCLESYDVRSYSIVVGGIKSDGTDGKKYAVDFLVSHENYSEIADNDIMLIRLKREIEFNKNVSPVQLPADDLNQYDNSTAVISGLGSTSLDSEFPEIMQFVHLRVLPQTECRKVMRRARILDSQLCSSGENQKAVCVGDSGGPLVVNGTQIGLVSFTLYENCSVKIPTVHTRITSFLPWIKKILHKYNDMLPR